MMRLQRGIWCMAVVWLGMPAFGVTVRFALSDFLAQPAANRRVLVAPLGPTTNASGVVSADLLRFTTDTNGVFWMSNVVAGYYEAQVQAPPTRSTLLFRFPSGTDTVEAKDYLVPPAAAPLNLGYTRGEVDALIAGAGGEATATNVVWTNNMLSSRVLWVDGARGNDATAQRQDPTRPWATVLAAATNAIEGDTVVVMAGAYLADSLGTNLANWLLEGGAEISSEYPVFTFTNAIATIAGAGTVTNTAGGSVLVLENSTVLLDGVTLGGRIELIGTNNVLTLRDCTVLGPRDWLLGGAGNDVRFFGAESAYICTNTAPSIVGTLGVRR